MNQITRKPSEEKVWMKYWEGVDVDTSHLDTSVYDFLLLANAEYPEETALIYYDRKISYGELFANIEATAKAYRKLGVKVGDIVTICSVMTPETVYSFYALSKLGATLNMVDPRTSPLGLHEYIEEVHSQVVMVIAPAYEKMREAVLGTGVKKVIINSPADSLPKMKKFLYNLANKGGSYAENAIGWSSFIADSANEPAAEAAPYDPNHAILIMHTGGTTGKPKGVLLSDRNENALAVQYVAKRAVGRQNIFLNVMPPFIAYGYGCGVHAPLYGGMQVVLIPQFDPKKLGLLLKKYRPNHMAGVPLHYQNLLTDPAVKHMDMSFLYTTGSGGDAITVEDEDLVNALFAKHNAPYLLNKGYGMTEVNAAAAVCTQDVNRRGSVGVPMVLTTVGIFKPETDEELDYNTEGEICFQTPTMMLGYYEMPDETEKVLRRHSDGQIWVHSGDLGKMDEDGFVYVLNRIKRVIIRHDGFKVYPYIIENEVMPIHGVDAACAVAVKDPEHKQGNLPFLFIKPMPGYEDHVVLEKVLRKACAEALPEYVQPAGYAFVDEFPYTQVGKVDYRALEEQAKL